MDLKAEYDQYITAIKARGLATAKFTLPCCGNELEDVTAPDGETWDTLSVCPHCETLYMKTSTSGLIFGRLRYEATAPASNNRR